MYIAFLNVNVDFPSHCKGADVVYSSDVSYRTQFFQVFSYMYNVQLRQKGWRQSYETL